MANLWKRWWFRALMGVLAAPFVMCGAALPILVVVGLILDGYVDWSGMVSTLPILALMAAVLAVLPWIAMEIGNFRRKRPLPPRLTAAWFGLGSAYLAVIAGLMAMFGTWFPAAHLGALMEKVGSGLTISLTVYVMSFVLAWLTLRPFVVKWAAAAGLADKAAVF